MTFRLHQHLTELIARNEEELRDEHVGRLERAMNLSLRCAHECTLGLTVTMAAVAEGDPSRLMATVRVKKTSLTPPAAVAAFRELGDAARVCDSQGDVLAIVGDDEIEIVMNVNRSGLKVMEQQC